MIRLYLFAEGQTEQTFASNVLMPHLAQMGVYMQPPVLIAHAKKKGIVHRGGGRKYLPMKNDIRRFLSQERSPNVFFTTMIDLYALPTDFPGSMQVERLSHLPEMRIEELEQFFAEDIGDNRFIPYIQLHEYEAYLFADPEKFGYFYEDSEVKIRRLQQIVEEKLSPEMINDGQHTAPSKRIAECFPDYDKNVMGPTIAELIGLGIIRSKCHHFANWLSRLENLSDL